MIEENRNGGRRSWSRRLFVVLIAVVAVLIAAGLAYEALAAAAAWRNYPPPGQLIDVGGYRLHLNVMGEDQGLPAVILEHGATGLSAQWGWVMPELASHTRVVAYDRPGMGWSDASPQQLEAPEAVEDLHVALQQAGVEGPYLLVGHSMGALMARLFAHTYPDETAGLVLVDPRDVTWEGVYAEEPQANPLIFRLLPLISRLGVARLYSAAAQEVQGLPPRQLEEAVAIAYSYHHVKNFGSEAHLGDGAAAFLAEREELGAIPLTVLSAADPDGTFNARQRAALTALHARLADRSSQGVHQIVDGAGHVSIVTHQEHAHVVVDAILAMLEAAR